MSMCHLHLARTALFAAAVASPVSAFGGFWLEDKLGFVRRMITPVTNATEKMLSSVSVQMKTRTVTGKDGKAVVEWRGHPVCGDGFAVCEAIAQRTPVGGMLSPRKEVTS